MGGQVQGVGYRAFVYNLAQGFNLTGVVQNLMGEVLVEATGIPNVLDTFAAALISESPPLACPYVISCKAIPLRELNRFEILPSATTLPRPHGKETESGVASITCLDNIYNIHIPTDNFLCDDCRREMLDPHDRRYRYPFINCTQCGPRYTLITRMPYDRSNTTMTDFPLCAACRTEYEDPSNRRFHAQPLACPACGPKLNFVSAHERAEGDAALAACITALHRGETVAVKGIGGYHLMCGALDHDAIAQLRRNKLRPHKPLAVMFPWQGEDGLQRVREELQLDAISTSFTLNLSNGDRTNLTGLGKMNHKCQLAESLTDTVRPIVLIPKRTDSTLPNNIAPGLNEIGVMLPYSPLHHLLLESFGQPLVMTSGNISGEPVITDNTEAEARLGKVTQSFLHHDRPIARPADDSVLRIIANQPRLLRAGRGCAPLEFDLPFTLPQPLLAVGGHMKNSIALGWSNRAVLSPHIGDLDSPRSMEIFEQVIADLQCLYGVAPQIIICDAHPGYGSSRWAAQKPLPFRHVYHHHAHASSLAFEGGLNKTWLAFTWDGMGLGDDGTLWGGETLHGKPGAWQRVASFKPFRLPGGERVGREPWRSAASLCWESALDWQLSKRDAVLLKSAWQQALNAPITSAVGRLFDAASNLLGLCDIASFEGQGPMLLEAAAQGKADAITFPLHENENGFLVADWTPLLLALRLDEISVAQRAMQFHTSLAQCIVTQAKRIHASTPFDAVGLTGGVFQNKLLVELAIEQLSGAGFSVYLPQQVPCNDGGLALGQLIEAAHQHG